LIDSALMSPSPRTLF